MPEGDTLKNAAARLAPLLVGRALDGAYDHGLRRGRLAGATVESVEALGKNLLIALATADGRVTARVHLGLGGRVRAEPRATLDEPALRRASLALLAGELAIVVRNARAVEWVRTAFVHAHAPLAALGPDLLGPDPDLDEVVRRARARAAADPALTVGELLLDQRVAAGLGNVYRSELCFLFRLHPATPAATLDDATLRALYARGRELLRANVGPWPRTTTADRARGARVPRGRGRLFVYGRARKPCATCGTLIVVTVEGRAARRVFFCPRCQPPPAPRTAT